MRSFVFACLISLAACAHSTGINVHAVRTEIKDSIAAHPGDAGPRTIISMGKVTHDSAVVFTERQGQPHQEESWVRGPSGWTLSATHEVGSSTVQAAP